MISIYEAINPMGIINTARGWFGAAKSGIKTFGQNTLADTKALGSDLADLGRTGKNLIRVPEFAKNMGLGRDYYKTIGKDQFASALEHAKRPGTVLVGAGGLAADGYIGNKIIGSGSNSQQQEPQPNQQMQPTDNTISGDGSMWDTIAAHPVLTGLGAAGALGAGYMLTRPKK